MSYRYIYRNECDERTEIFCRNVTTKNPDSALQFEIQQQRKSRNYFFTFSLPASEIPKFLEEIQKQD